MSPRWAMFLLFSLVILGFLSSISDGNYGSENSVYYVWNGVAHFQSITTTNPLTAIYSVFQGIGDFLLAIWNACIWNYGFLSGGLYIVRVILCAITFGLFAYFVFDAYRLVRSGG